MNKEYKKGKKRNFYDVYRRILERPDLTDQAIDKMRYHVRLLAQTVCEHVWRKKFY